MIRLAQIFLTLIILATLTGCLSFGGGTLPKAQPFNSPMTRRLIANVPFFPDNTFLCGPATLAAVITFQGRPTTIEDISGPLLRTNLRGSLAPDLVLLAREMGLKARFWSAQPEEILKIIDQGHPLILQIDSGLALKTGHFVVALGYGPEGLVINTDTVRQAIMPWSEFLTRWRQYQNLAILVENPRAPNKEGAEVSPDLQQIPHSVLVVDKP
jgi:hypothetical protein